MEKFIELSAAYLAQLRLMYLFYQNCHWQVKGKKFYSEHLLFQRLYEELAETVDGTAEKIMGTLDSKSVDIFLHLDLFKTLIKNFISVDDKFKLSEIECIQKAVIAEKAFRVLSEKLKATLEEEKKMSLGWDDLIASNYSASESRSYLLSQSLE